MPIVKKAPAIMTREVRLEEPVNELLEDYARFIESNADHVINAVLKKVLWRDQDYRKWREARRTAQSGTDRSQPTEARASDMMQKVLESRVFLSAILAMASGAFLFYTHPFHDDQVFLRVIALRAPQAFLSFKYLYYLLLFTTPVPHLLDRAFWSLHLHSESAPRYLARTPSPVSRSQ